MRSAVIVDTDILIDLAHENEVAIKDFCFIEELTLLPYPAA